MDRLEFSKNTDYKNHHRVTGKTKKIEITGVKRKDCRKTCSHFSYLIKLFISRYGVFKLSYAFVRIILVTLTTLVGSLRARWL